MALHPILSEFPYTYMRKKLFSFLSVYLTFYNTNTRTCIWWLGAVGDDLICLEIVTLGCSKFHFLREASSFNPIFLYRFRCLGICIKFFLSYTDKKENQIFLIYEEFRVEQLQSHIWLMASSYMGKYMRISSYIRKPFLIYDCATAPLWISLYMRKIWLSFYQCKLPACIPRPTLQYITVWKVEGGGGVASDLSICRELIKSLFSMQ